MYKLTATTDARLDNIKDETLSNKLKVIATGDVVNCSDAEYLHLERSGLIDGTSLAGIYGTPACFTAQYLGGSGGGGGGNDPITTNTISLNGKKIKSTVANSSSVTSNELDLSALVSAGKVWTQNMSGSVPSSTYTQNSVQLGTTDTTPATWTNVADQSNGLPATGDIVLVTYDGSIQGGVEAFRVNRVPGPPGNPTVIMGFRIMRPIIVLTSVDCSTLTVGGTMNIGMNTLTPAMNQNAIAPYTYILDSSGTRLLKVNTLPNPGNSNYGVECISILGAKGMLMYANSSFVQCSDKDYYVYLSRPIAGEIYTVGAKLPAKIGDYGSLTGGLYEVGTDEFTYGAGNPRFAETDTYFGVVFSKTNMNIGDSININESSNYIFTVDNVKNVVTVVGYDDSYTDGRFKVYVDGVLDSGSINFTHLITKANWKRWNNATQSEEQASAVDFNVDCITVTFSSAVGNNDIIACRDSTSAMRFHFTHTIKKPQSIAGAIDLDISYHGEFGSVRNSLYLDDLIVNGNVAGYNWYSLYMWYDGVGDCWGSHPITPNGLTDNTYSIHPEFGSADTNQLRSVSIMAVPTSVDMSTYVEGDQMDITDYMVDVDLFRNGYASAMKEKNKLYRYWVQLGGGSGIPFGFGFTSSIKRDINSIIDLDLLDRESAESWILKTPYPTLPQDPATWVDDLDWQPYSGAEYIRVHGISGSENTYTSIVNWTRNDI